MFDEDTDEVVILHGCKGRRASVQGSNRQGVQPLEMSLPPVMAVNPSVWGPGTRLPSAAMPRLRQDLKHCQNQIDTIQCILPSTLLSESPTFTPAKSCVGGAPLCRSLPRRERNCPSFLRVWAIF
jgi:hypothetical protein